MSSLVTLGRCPEKMTEPNTDFAKLHTDSILILVTSDGCSRVSFLLAWITVSLNLHLAFASSSGSGHALVPAIHLTMVVGAKNFMFPRMKSPISLLSRCVLHIINLEPWWMVQCGPLLWTSFLVAVVILCLCCYSSKYRIKPPICKSSTYDVGMMYSLITISTTV